jgi:hypothetical protein
MGLIFEARGQGVNASFYQLYSETIQLPGPAGGCFHFVKG